MEFNFFMLSEGSFIDSNGKLMVGTPITYFHFEHFPANFSFTLVFGLMGIDLKKPHTLRIEIIDPDLQSLIDQYVPIPPDPKEATIKTEDDVKSMVSSLDLRNFVFPKSGEYTFKLTIDDVTVEKNVLVTKIIQNT